MRAPPTQLRGRVVYVWWAARAWREQLLLGLLAAVIVVALFVVLLWRPIQDAKAEAVAEMESYAGLRAEMRAAGPALAGRAPLRGASSPTLVAESAAQFGLPISRLEPGASGTRVVMQDVAFDSLARWLDRLERDGGVTISAVRLTRRPAPGVVNAELTLQTR